MTLPPPNRKIALLVEAPQVEGGIQASAHRHAALLSEQFDIIPIAFAKSRQEADWAGRTERITAFGRPGYLITAADLKADHRWSDSSSIENIRQDLRFRAYADHLIDIVRSEGIALIHAYGAFHQRGMIAAYAGSKSGVPAMLSLRGTDLETRMFDGMLAPLAASIAAVAHVVTVSEDSARLVRDVFRPRGPVSVIRNHFDPSVFGTTDIDIPLLRGFEGPVIGCFGKFRRVMGLDFLLEAFATLAEQRGAVLLLGGSIQKREVEFYNALLEAHPAAASILRTGPIPHGAMLGHLRRCDAVVYPSLSDASPNKILEAMYARTPIVSTMAGGIPELVRDGTDALLVPPRSSGPIIDAVGRLLDEPGLAGRLTEAAHRRVTEDFAIGKERALWQRVYAETLGD